MMIGESKYLIQTIHRTYEETFYHESIVQLDAVHGHGCGLQERRIGAPDSTGYAP